MVELGCGLSEKTSVLLDAFSGTGDLRRSLPFDVDGDVLKMAAAELLERYPGSRSRGSSATSNSIWTPSQFPAAAW